MIINLILLQTLYTISHRWPTLSRFLTTVQFRTSLIFDIRDKYLSVTKILTTYESHFDLFSGNCGNMVSYMSANTRTKSL
jgi:hypothetical protein